MTRAPQLGLIVNPIAGMGGRVGLKGTDGAATLARALALGAAPIAQDRAIRALRSLEASGRADGTVIHAAPGAMGETAAHEVGLPVEPIAVTVVGSSFGAAETIASALILRERAVDLLLFVGGDGTARDICSAIGTDLPVVGVPSGVKMHSAVFATGPRAAADIAATFLAAPDRSQCHEREVVDLDEDAYRRGVVAIRLFGVLSVPDTPRGLQALKTGSSAADAWALDGLAGAVVDGTRPGDLLILGPGTTTRAVASALGVDKTLLGVDAVVVDAAGRGRTVVADATERDLLDLLKGKPGRWSDPVAFGTVRIIVSPTGGQGFLIGRGNQQISPAVVATVGWRNLVVIATPGKLAALGGAALLVDTGDETVDAAAPDRCRVITGPRTETVCRIAPA